MGKEETHHRKRATALGKENVSVLGFGDRNTPSLPTELITCGFSVPRPAWSYHRSTDDKEKPELAFGLFYKATHGFHFGY
jgi:hypothetical protein